MRFGGDWLQAKRAIRRHRRHVARIPRRVKHAPSLPCGAPARLPKPPEFLLGTRWSALGAPRCFHWGSREPPGSWWVSLWGVAGALRDLRLSLWGLAGAPGEPVGVPLGARGSPSGPPAVALGAPTVPFAPAGDPFGCAADLFAPVAVPLRHPSDPSGSLSVLLSSGAVPFATVE